MHHTAAWYQSVDPASAYVNLNTVADTQLTVTTSAIQIPSLNNIVYVAGGAETTVAPRLRLSAPSLRNRSLYQVSPLNPGSAAAVLPANPHAVLDLRRNPLVMVPTEQVQAQLFSDPAAAQIQWCVINLAPGPVEVVSGPIFTVRATGTTTLTTGTWTNVALTFDENLPRGRYQIVGAKFLSTNCIAGRVLVPGQTWRPGGLGNATTQQLESPILRNGQHGVWGEFEDVDAISADFLATVADIAEIVFLDLIQLRAGPG